jgi:protoporphyrinogen oxidase
MTDSSSQQIAIVGGGMLGMTLALRLAQAGHRVTLFEAADQLGGLAAQWQLGDITWDKHYHVTLLSDLSFRQVLGELGLESSMEWVRTRTGVYADGRLYSVSNAVEFLRFPALKMWDKFRLAATIVGGSKIRDPLPLERELVADWLTRWSGPRTFQKFWLPLLKAKLGENYRKTSAAFIWATIARLYAARRSGLKEEMFGYVPGGYDRILTTFADRLRALGVDIRLSSRVTEVRSEAGHIEIESAGDGFETFDRVALTVPAPVAAQLCPQLTSAERQRLDQIEYQGIVCASVLLRQPLADFYVTNITETWIPFTAVIEMSALVDRQKYLGGHSLVYLPKYVTPDDEAWTLNDQEIQERFLSALERLYPAFSRDDVQAFRVSRVRYVMSLPTLNYSQGLPGFRTSLPGVYLASSFQIVNGTLNVNETVGLAEQAARTIVSETSATQTQGSVGENDEADCQPVARSR